MGTPSGAEGRGTSGGRVTAGGVGREEVEAAETLRATDAVAVPSGQPVVTVVGVVDDDEAERTERTPALQSVDDKHESWDAGDPCWMSKDSVSVTRRLRDVMVRISPYHIGVCHMLILIFAEINVNPIVYLFLSAPVVLVLFAVIAIRS